MTEELQVIADGVSPERVSRPKNSPWFLVLLAFILGVGVGAAFVSPPDDSEGEGSEADGIEPPVVETVPQVTDSGLAEVVNGFSGSIVVLSESGFGRFSKHFWPSNDALATNVVGAGESPRADLSGQIMAAIETVPGLDGGVLSTGRTSGLEPVAFGVNSYQWHDGRAGILGFSTIDNDQWQLWRSFGDIEPTLVASVPVDEIGAGVIAAWGDWGWAIQASEDQIILLTPDGRVKTVRDGVAYGSTPDGWIVVVNERVELVSGGGGVQNVQLAPDRVGDVRWATTSPSGEYLAVAGSDGLVVSPLNGQGTGVIEFDLQVSGEFVWTEDERFIVAPVGRGIAVLDLTRVVRQVLLSQFAVVDVVAVGS